ncbi:MULTISPECIES: dicarboxylate/amino acid:cation symporter [unclassified Lysobacter]|uniref:dicarboxylate/amino acid:cation symporter n=1 Tax=unclassified Lysobacter TaxID=2635362 RepID=UPI0006FA29C9|nr:MULTISPECIES: dicarboxylate/amino acid:cation symporter [unclassified Lysobacter]KRA19837.1 C4-dicarboxylate transporter [Lysobacter sp. Root604]KRD38850.1 C4-dicarboxylate transporter [Lysobacter sp. Root916]KRD78413.1 C4-dicarboxylate transporter [Lysobacter sp. Root983]
MKSPGSRFYLWVLGAIVLGGAVGHFFPDFGVKLKPLGDGFIGLIKMLIAPIIFLTVVLGIAGVADVKKVGRVGAKAILYFEVVSTFALVIGLVVVNTLKPGAGFNVNVADLDPKKVAEAIGYAHKAEEQSTVDFLLHIIPKTFTDAFTGEGSLLQVLLLAVLFGFALLHMGKAGEKVMDLFETLSKAFFGIMSMIMKLAPIGAGAAMAFTIGKFGIESLGPLLKLMGSFYLTCALFVLVVLGLIARLTGFSILRFIRYIRDELLLVLGTSSSESALVPLMRKLERLGCSKPVVGLVVPSGYSFNLDGTNIYLTMAAIFVAQALNVELTLTQELTLLAVAMLTSKGASGVTGAGFITLAATLTVVPSVPVAGLALILGIDRFMSEARALTNIIGNGVATIVVARWENELDRDRLQHELLNPPSVADLDAELALERAPRVSETSG